LIWLQIALKQPSQIVFRPETNHEKRFSWFVSGLAVLSCFHDRRYIGIYLLSNIKWRFKLGGGTTRRNI
jgi:hypothetical protein